MTSLQRFMYPTYRPARRGECCGTAYPPGVGGTAAQYHPIVAPAARRPGYTIRLKFVRLLRVIGFSVKSVVNEVKA